MSEDTFPQNGIEVSVRHFLQVPALPEFSVDSEEDVHMVIKLEEDGSYQVVHESWQVDSSYLSFLEQTSFCKYGVFSWLGYCKHRFPKKLVISQLKVTNQSHIV